MYFGVGDSVLVIDDKGGFLFEGNILAKGMQTKFSVATKKVETEVFWIVFIPNEENRPKLGSLVLDRVCLSEKNLLHKAGWWRLPVRDDAPDSDDISWVGGEFF